MKGDGVLHRLFVSFFPINGKDDFMNINQVQENNSTWKHKIALFIISQNLSLFGSSVVSFAIIWYITLQTSSGTWVMLFTIFSLLPQVLISLWAGVWADRYNRKHLIMLADGFIALATLGLVIAFLAGYQSMELLLVISAVRSIGAGIQTPAIVAMYPQIVPVEKLTRVQGINQTLNSVLMLLSPAVGGIVLGSLGITWAFMLDVITASLAIIALGFMHVEKVVRSEEVTGVLTELRQGITYTLNHKLLKRTLIIFGVSFVLITPAAVLTPLLVERSFGSDVWRLTANEIVWTVGTLIGGAFVSLRGEFRDKIFTVAVCLVAFGITFALLGIAKNFTIYLLIMGAAGFFMPIIATAQTVLIQENVEAAMMGRVFSLVQIVTGTAMPVAILFFGPLADIISIGLILLVTGILLALTGVLYQITSKRAGISY
ncbi:MFS transporter [Desulfallas thermosapovorans]|uniref:DHA3 family macrolide efflux protein-like MFS transporter n=1 Tax=Desulfallas thermosapovorans DSM 6562 TaxID=1121431 RepID=A0A5S4ZTE7_9FIRM|nr:MFS transporter [Desulfallas thermosapovorans]TYO95358.1 DHA3 family macrolide efflux protein-like MFS transporter [Desulfallas thermosapovorans DSM 6562]